MQKRSILFCLYSFLSITLPLSSIPLESSEVLFIAITQGNASLVERLLNHGIPMNTQNETGGNSPLMEAIISLGEKIIEIEAQALTDELSDPKKLTNEFRPFLRSFIVSLIIGASASELQSNIEKINNDDKNLLITLIQSLANSFLPVVSRGAYVWCAYSLLDYGIATGQKNSNQSNTESNIIEKYKKTIDVLLSKPTIDINYTNHQGESALTLINKYKNKIKSEQFKLILYQIEQALLNESALNCPDNYNHAQDYQ